MVFKKIFDLEPKEVVDRCVLMNYYDKDANYKITQMWVAVRVA